MNCFVFSNYINAWSINKALKKLNLGLEVISPNTGLLPKSIKKPKKGDILFFTEESSMTKYVGLPDYRYYPKKMYLPIDDKLAFSKYLENMGEQPVPYLELFDGANVPQFPFYIKARYSWKGSTKMPRGYICNNLSDYKNTLKKINDTYNLSDFFIQKLLLSPIENNISCSGFFDYLKPNRNIFIVSRKLLGDSEKMPTGCIVETISDPSDLLSRTYNILMNLQYRGPFELEFYFENNNYYVLEFNPRFWMQHGIFIDYYENSLIKRYLDLDIEDKSNFTNDNTFKHIIWCDAIYLISNLLLLNLKKVRLFFKTILHTKKTDTNVIFYPDITTAIVYTIKSIFKAIYKRLRA